MTKRLKEVQGVTHIRVMTSELASSIPKEEKHAGPTSAGLSLAVNVARVREDSELCIKSVTDGTEFDFLNEKQHALILSWARFLYAALSEYKLVRMEYLTLNYMNPPQCSTPACINVFSNSGVSLYGVAEKNTMLMLTLSREELFKECIALALPIIRNVLTNLSCDFATLCLDHPARSAEVVSCEFVDFLDDLAFRLNMANCTNMAVLPCSARARDKAALCLIQEEEKATEQAEAASERRSAHKASRRAREKAAGKARAEAELTNARAAAERAAAKKKAELAAVSDAALQSAMKCAQQAKDNGRMDETVQRLGKALVLHRALATSATVRAACMIRDQARAALQSQKRAGIGKRREGTLAAEAAEAAPAEFVSGVASFAAAIEDADSQQRVVAKSGEAGRSSSSSVPCTPSPPPQIVSLQEALSKSHMTHEKHSSPKPDSDAEIKNPCVVCLDAVSVFATVPCGHLSLCTGCVDAVRCTKTPLCPKCRTPLVGDGVMRIFSD